MGNSLLYSFGQSTFHDPCCAWQLSRMWCQIVQCESCWPFSFLSKPAGWHHILPFASASEFLGHSFLLEGYTLSPWQSAVMIPPCFMELPCMARAGVIWGNMTAIYFVHRSVEVIGLLPVRHACFLLVCFQQGAQNQLESQSRIIRGCTLPALPFAIRTVRTVRYRTRVGCTRETYQYVPKIYGDTATTT